MAYSIILFHDLNPGMKLWSFICYLRNHQQNISTPMSCNNSIRRHGNGCLRDTVTDAPFIPWVVRYTASSAKRDQVAIKPEHFLEAYAERDKLGRRSLIMMALTSLRATLIGVNRELRLGSTAVRGTP